MMTTTSIRISKIGKRNIERLARRLQQSQRAVLEEAIELYRREVFFDELDAAYEALRSNPEAWQAELAERAEWDMTLADGMEDECSQ